MQKANLNKAIISRITLLTLTLFLSINLVTAQTSVNPTAGKKTNPSCACEDSCWSLPLTLLKFPGLEKDTLYTVAVRILCSDNPFACKTVSIDFSDGTHWAFEGDNFNMVTWGEPEYFVHFNLDGEAMQQKLTSTKVTRFKLCDYELNIKKRDQEKLLHYFNCIRRRP